MTKKEIRKEKIAARRIIAERKDFDKKILQKITEQDFYKSAGTVMVYISYNGEVDTFGLINHMLNDGKTLCAPVCVDKETMVAKKFSEVSELISGAYGILEPRGEEVSHVDLIIVPGVAFSEDLHRIGYGAGYYDRFLRNSDAVTCGLFYEMQKADFAPDERDKKLDYVITEEKIYRQEN